MVETELVELEVAVGVLAEAGAWVGVGVEAVAAEVEALVLDSVLNAVPMSMVIGELAAAHWLSKVVFAIWICCLISFVKRALRGEFPRHCMQSK